MYTRVAGEMLFITSCEVCVTLSSSSSSLLPDTGQGTLQGV